MVYYAYFIYFADANKYFLTTFGITYEIYTNYNRKLVVFLLKYFLQILLRWQIREQ